MVLLPVATLALGACGGNKATTGSTLPEATPSVATPSLASPSPIETYGEITSGTSSAAASAAEETSMAVSYAEPPYSPTDPHAVGVVGWEFVPKVDIGVTELGCFDGNQDGLARPHRVGIFDARTKCLLASVTVGPDSALDGAFRWESLRTPLILKAGRPCVVGAQNDNRDETLYEDEAWREARWAPEVAYRGMRTSLGYAKATGFPAPTNPRRVWAMTVMTYMSPNFKFERVVRLTSEADNPTHLDAPGTASLAQTKAVARRYAAVLSARKMVGAGLYAADATRDLEGGVTRGAKNIERGWYESYHEGPGVIAVRRWSSDYHLLVAPGIAVWEGARSEGPGEDLRWYLTLLAVGGDKIAHEEVYFVGNGLEDRWPMRFSDTSPGPKDTAEIAAKVAAAVGKAFAARNRAALETLLAPNVIFPEIADRPGMSGRKALFDWWTMLAPRRMAKIVVRDETPLAGPGWAVVRWTARRWVDKSWLFPDGFLVSANMATVIEVRGGKVVRIVPYGEAEGGESGLVNQ